MFYRLLDDVTDLVRADGQPRTTRGVDQDGAESRHMVFRDGDAVRSCLIEDWPAEQQALAAREAARTKRAALKQGLRAAAAAHAGKRADALTLPELRDLVALLLEQAGMLDEDGQVA